MLRHDVAFTACQSRVNGDCTCDSPRQFSRDQKPQGGHRPTRLLRSCADFVKGKCTALKGKSHPALLPQRSMPPLKLQIS